MNTLKSLRSKCGIHKFRDKKKIYYKMLLNSRHSILVDGYLFLFLDFCYSKNEKFYLKRLKN